MLALDEWLVSYPQSGESEHRDDVAPEIGAVIGGIYRVVGPLGSGSMGVVLLAHDETLDRHVAIKFTRSHPLTATFRERFIAEARAMARVSHPNVVQIHAFGEHQDVPYFVMEHVPGQTLEQWLATNAGPPAVDVSLGILDALCRGVTAIHAANCVHHDIKPSNVLLDEELRPRIGDLGLATFYRQDRIASREIVGTPAYMAPEIPFSKEPSPELRARADVYSLGCVAYELLTGHPPFEGTTNIGLLLRHALEPVEPPSRRRSGLPPTLDAAVLRAMAKDPKERTPSAEEFRQELAAARDREGEPARILVAEDDDAFREALKLFLTLQFPNTEIECVSNGVDALKAVARKAPSVAILDLQLPRLDGLELTRLLRARHSSAAMPIIIVTACGGPKQWKRLAALGADRFLVKPVVMDDIVALVCRVLGRPSNGASAKPARAVKEAGSRVDCGVPA
jgi:serine/threonine protein kinase